MKNIFVLFISFIIPVSAMAHPESHTHYGFMDFLAHVFTQPDHLLFMVAVIAVVSACRVFLVQK